MRMVTRIFPVAALALGLGAAQLSAQQPGNGTFQWYVGGQGGVMNFETPLEGHITKPVGGVHLLVVAKRTGLLLSVEQAFGSDQLGAYNVAVFDSTGNVSSSNDFGVNWNSHAQVLRRLDGVPHQGADRRHTLELAWASCTPWGTLQMMGSPRR